VLLFADVVRFGDPRANVGIDLLDRIERQTMPVIAGRVRLDFVEAGTVDAAAEDESEEEPVFASGTVEPQECDCCDSRTFACTRGIATLGLHLQIPFEIYQL
jgi:hypothetical protein